jgi:peptide/nickel transport system substrate-binding protein
VTKEYDRRQFLTHSAAAAGGVVAAGAVAGEMALAGPAGAVTSGGTLKMGVIAEQNQPFSPAHATMDTSGFCYARAVYDPLMVTSSDGKSVYPYLAKSLTPNKTYTAWTITARPGVKFHDGTPCDGDAIAANMAQNMASDLTGPAVQALISGFTHTKGSDTVVIHCKHPWVTFPYTLAEQQISFIASPGSKTAPNTLLAGYTGLPIGTGPFIAQTWNYEVSFETVKNTNYWQAGRPYLAGVTFYPIVDGPTRFKALQSNQVDIIHEAEGDVLSMFPTLSKSSYTYVKDFPGTPVYAPSSTCLMMNTAKTPFNNKNLRIGLAYAMQQSQIVKIVDYNQSSVINGIFLPGSPYYKKPPYPSYNKAMAKKYIKKVPAADRKFVIDYVKGDTAAATTLTLVTQFFSAVGVTFTTNPVVQGSLILAAVYGAYQCMTWAQFGGVSPDLNHPWFTSIKPPGYPKKGIWLNFARNDDPKIEALMLSAMASKSVSARRNAWAAVNIRLQQDLPYLWIDRVSLGVAASTKVQNWKTYEFGGKGILQPNQAVLFFTSTWLSP